MKKIEFITYMLIPILICVIILYGIKKKINVYETFIEGALEGGKIVVKIFPTILAIIVAISIFKESGALNLLIRAIEPVTNFFEIPNEVVPLGFMSSISGGASIGLLSEILQTYGADSKIGKISSTILGSSETTLYVLAIYTSTIKNKKMRGALFIGLVCDFVALVIAVWLCK